MKTFSPSAFVILFGLWSRQSCWGFTLKDVKTPQDDEVILRHLQELPEGRESATEPPPSGSKLGVYENGAVTADGNPCSAVGVDIMKLNGSAVDSTIATLFCLGVVVQESMGIGGGFLLTYYDKPTKQSYVLDARETAPGAAFEDMFGGNETLSAYGGLSIAVPGETRGYWEFYQRFGGSLPWADLIEPSIALCEDGFPVTSHMARALKSKREIILNEPSMSTYVDPSTGDVYNEGDILRRPVLANTLRALQTDPDALYTGELAEAFHSDLVSVGSIITREDMENYRPIWREPVQVEFANTPLTMHSVPPPGSGVILGYILNILDNYSFDPESLNEENLVTTNQRITESFKYAYAKRTELGDESFEDMVQLIFNLTSNEFAYDTYSKISDDWTSQDPEYYGAVTYSGASHGTSHLSVFAPDGSAVSVTSTVNLYFGAGVASSSTDVVLNDEMDDFSSPNITNSFGLPPSPANFIVPGKRPVSSMCPAIFTDSNGDVLLITGAAGGSMISSATAWVALQNIWFGKDMKEAVDARRIHHQLFPMILEYETDYRSDIIEGLETIGHETSKFYPGESAVTGIALGSDGLIYANCDFRKGADAEGF